MKTTITSLRRELFKLADRALEGEPLEFTHRGVVFHVIPENKPSKLARLSASKVVRPGTDAGQASRELLKEMESEWEKDWSEL
ncbi:MAG: hypothetical protein ABI165_07810 [Bryobacteraceae bacterium]